MCTTDGTMVQSVKVKVCIGTDARCSNLVRSVHDLCTAKKCRQKSFGHSILAEQVAVWNVPARGSKPSESVVATGRRRRRVSQHFSGVELWSFEVLWSCGVLSEDFQGRKRRVEVDF